jgi:hypothetical protein
MEMVPIGNYDPFQTYVYGETLVNLDQWSLLVTWYSNVLVKQVVPKNVWD